MNSPLPLHRLLLAVTFLLTLFGAGCGDVYVERYRNQPPRKLDVDGEQSLTAMDYNLVFGPYAGREVRILCYRDNCVSPVIRDRLQNEFGIRLVLDACESWIEVLGKIDSDDPYDLLFFSDHLLAELERGGKLAPLDTKYIPNLTKLERGGLVDELSQLFADLEIGTIVPYSWGSLGLALNVDALGGERYPWRLLFEPDSVTPPRGALLLDRMSGRNDVRVTVGTALISLGYSPNTTNLVEVTAAGELLQKQITYIDRYDSRNHNEKMISEDDLLAMEWSGPATTLKHDNPNISFLIPDEGSIVMLEAFALANKSGQKELSQLMINYLLTPSVAGANASATRIASALRAARQHTERSLITGSAYAFPDPVSNAHRLHTLPDHVLAEYLSVWEATQIALAKRKNISQAELQFQTSLAVACSVPEKVRLRAPFDTCFTVVNDGQTVSKDTILKVEIPEGIEFQSADSGGELVDRSIVWDLESIIADRFKQVCAQFRSNEIQPVTFHATISTRVIESIESTCQTEIIGIPAVEFDLVDSDPAEVGDTVTYDIRLSNRGNGPDHEAVMEVWADDIQSLLSAQGPGEFTIDGNHIRFSEIQDVPAGAEFVYQIKVRAEQAGVARFKAQVKSRYKKVPITESESTTQF